MNHSRPGPAVHRLNAALEKFSHFATAWTGSTWAFAIAVAVIVVWAVTGPLFRFSDTWQLVINTGTTIITFLMVFIIQNSQNRDARAIQLKLDELIRAVKGARTGMVRLEELTDQELSALTGDFEKLRARLAATGQGLKADCSLTDPPASNVRAEGSGSVE